MRPLLVTIRLRNSSTRTWKPGCTGTVEPNSSMIAGPGHHLPGLEGRALHDRRVDVPLLGVEADRPSRVE